MQAGIRIEPVFEIESREGVWKAVERGLGISVVADFEFVPHPNLRALEIGDRTIKTQYSIAHHSGRGHSPIIKAFIETVRRMKEPTATGDAATSPFKEIKIPIAIQSTEFHANVSSRTLDVDRYAELLYSTTI